MTINHTFIVSADIPPIIDSNHISQKERTCFIVFNINDNENQHLL